MADITHLPASILSEKIHKKEVSCVKVMESFLKRIHAVNGAVNAIVSLRSDEELLEEAKKADEELEHGKSRGWLHGLPVAVKDLANVAGLKTSMGSILFKDYVSPADSLVTARMRKEGAIFIGKTNAPEFGLGSHSYNFVFGTTVNPYDVTKAAGGSSGGAGAALGAYLVPVADGSDMMGSIRVYYAEHATSGPMARTIGDLKKLFHTMAGYDPRSPIAIPDGVAFQGEDAGDVPVKIGWLGNLAGLAIEQDLLEASEKACFKMAEAPNVSVEAVGPVDFDYDALWDAFVKWRAWKVSLLVEELPLPKEVKKDKMKPEAVWEWETGLKLSAMDIGRVSRVRTLWYNKVLELFQKYDFLVLPSTQLKPFPQEWHWPKQVAGKEMDTYHRWMQIVMFVSMLGLPTLAQPVGFVGGLPMGLQVFGPRLSDGKLLNLGERLENIFAEARQSQPLDKQVL